MTTQEGQRYQLSRLLYSQDRPDYDRRVSGSNQPRVAPTLQDVHCDISSLSAERTKQPKKLTLIVVRCLDKSMSNCGENVNKVPSNNVSSTTAVDKNGSQKRRPVACSIKLTATPTGRSPSVGYCFSEKPRSTKSIQSKGKLPSFFQDVELGQSQRFGPLSSGNNSGVKEEGVSPLETKSAQPLTIQPFLSRKRGEQKKGPKVSVGIQIAPKIFEAVGGCGIPSKQPKIIFNFPESWKPTVCKRIELKDSTGPVISFETLRKEAKPTMPLRSSSGASSFKKTDGALDLGKTTEQIKSSLFKSLKSKHLSGSESKVFSEDLCNNSSHIGSSYD